MSSNRDIPVAKAPECLWWTPHIALSDITKDLYWVDFTDFEVNRSAHLENNRIKRDVAITRTNAVDQLLVNQDVFQEDSKTLCLTNIVVLNKLKSMKQSLRHVHDLHRKDLLYYYIVDLTTSRKQQAVWQALNDTQIQHYRSLMKAEFRTDQAVVNFVMSIIKASAKNPLMDALKDAKALLKALPNDNPHMPLKQAVCKMTKICAAALFIDGNKFSGAWNEVSN
ncbi:hypothetical protein V8B55DRAFT_1342711 [Mucor lusitanicus]|uniref:Uncharacterized protein n=1 Tax=Mucor lusitanicus CBS 277.49 TaxID=747725 RepID=A0A168N2M3_MUCCL|nr:hypothetical protein MUCCIDRAFT_159417 [Mucor lusitanicus CBS 277.49]